VLRASSSAPDSWSGNPLSCGPISAGSSSAGFIDGIDKAGPSAQTAFAERQLLAATVAWAFQWGMTLMRFFRCFPSWEQHPYCHQNNVISLWSCLCQSTLTEGHAEPVSHPLSCSARIRSLGTLLAALSGCSFLARPRPLRLLKQRAPSLRGLWLRTTPPPSIQRAVAAHRAGKVRSWTYPPTNGSGGGCLERRQPARACCQVFDTILVCCKRPAGHGSPLSVQR